MPARRQVIVWSWSLQTGPFAGDDAQALLSDDEEARQRSFVSPELRRRFLAARAGLRTLLGRHLDLDPRSLAFATNEFGKPWLVGDGQVHFNLSHCEERAVLAVSEAAEVGIDLERERPIEHVDLARRYFHPNEVAAITASRDEAAQRRAFFVVWTLKEAIVKALGTGLSTPLDSFEVAVGASSPRLAVAPEGAPRTWWLHAAMADGYCCALAVPGISEVELIQRTV
ncbi:MAG TPA: 4'-phosphopantetheinyl transferase superfamily protein [Reyranella sp.]|jgi:4'-phosphopantetheinyl transferase|nr:4'-phosphopantetheinyl transferase superfamily protein [Reyranella sp.]